MVFNTSVKQEAIRLRVEERKSYTEIQEVLGISKGALSGWLHTHPLTEEEKRAKMGAHTQPASRKSRGAEATLHQMAPSRDFGRLQKAKIAETAVLLRLLMYGFSPFGSVFDGEKTDWLVEIPQTGLVHKVQVKWASRGGKYGLPEMRIRCRGGRRKTRAYREGEFDFIVGYVYFTDTCYVWSWDEVRDSRAKAVCSDAAEKWGKFLGPQRSG